MIITKDILTRLGHAEIRGITLWDVRNNIVELHRAILLLAQGEVVEAVKTLQDIIATNDRLIDDGFDLDDHIKYTDPLDDEIDEGRFG